MADNRTKANLTLDWALENTGISMDALARYLINDYLNSDMALDAINSFLEDENGIDLEEVAVLHRWDRESGDDDDDEIDPDDDNFFDDND